MRYNSDMFKFWASSLLLVALVFSLPLPASLAQTTGNYDYSVVPSSFTFAKDLKVGSRGQDVKYLQCILGLNPDGVFGKQTKAALAKFQEDHAEEILTPAGLTTGTGFFGRSTRSYVNAQVAEEGSTSPVCGTKTGGQSGGNGGNGGNTGGGNGGTNNSGTQSSAQNPNSQNNLTSLLPYILLFNNRGGLNYGNNPYGYNNSSGNFLNPNGQYTSPTSGGGLPSNVNIPSYLNPNTQPPNLGKNFGSGGCGPGYYFFSGTGECLPNPTGSNSTPTNTTSNPINPDFGGIITKNNFYENNNYKTCGCSDVKVSLIRNENEQYPTRGPLYLIAKDSDLVLLGQPYNSNGNNQSVPFAGTAPIPGVCGLGKYLAITNEENPDICKTLNAISGKCEPEKHYFISGVVTEMHTQTGACQAAAPKPANPGLVT